MTYPDHFTPVAAQYAASRPRYPDALFTWLASLTSGHTLAWDAGCGSGQASTALAVHFEQVVATDASAAQVANAEPRANLTYHVAGECTETLRDQSVDLVTVAQAVHWFDRERFWPEVQRVLKRNGVLAVWTYELAEVTPEVDAAVLPWYRDVLGPYWPAERAHVETGYREIGFPYPLLQTPSFAMSVRWSRSQFIAYLRTWSAVQAYGRAQNADALDEVVPPLIAVWPDYEARQIRWPMTVLAGRRTAG